IEVVAASAFIPLSNERAFTELAARAITREPGPITCIVPARFMPGLVPSLRKRIGDRLETRLWMIGDPTGVAFSLDGTIPPERAISFFKTSVAILLAGESALLARMEDRSFSGFWTSDPGVVGATRGAAAALTAGT